MHPLRQYLESIEEPITDFAARVGASRQTLYRIISRAQAPKPALARRIVEATGGAVSFETLYVNPGAGLTGAYAPEAGSGLDHERLKRAIACVVHHYAPAHAPVMPEADAGLAAEAAAATYDALSRITRRRGQRRLQQALRPVFAEILIRDGDRFSSAALDRAAQLGAGLYFEGAL